MQEIKLYGMDLLNFQNTVVPPQFDPVACPFVFVYDSFKQNINIQKLYRSKAKIGILDTSEASQGGDVPPETPGEQLVFNVNEVIE